MHTNQQLARTRNACSGRQRQAVTSRGRQKQAEAGKGRQRQGVASSGRKWHEAMKFPENTAGARGSRCRHLRAKRSGLRPYARAAAELGSSGLPAKAHTHTAGRQAPRHNAHRVSHEPAGADATCTHAPRCVPAGHDCHRHLGGMNCCLSGNLNKQLPWRHCCCPSRRL